MSDRAPDVAPDVSTSPRRRARRGGASARSRTALQTGLGLGLLALVGVEMLVLSRQPTAERVVVLVTGVLVCLCVLPLPRLSLTVRAALASTLSIATTVLLLVFGHGLRDWGLGEALALLVLLAEVLYGSALRTVVRLGPVLAIAAVGAPARDAHPGPFTWLAAALTALVTAQTLSLRIQDGRRVAGLAAVRLQERRELARELHDLVAHHIAGIVVQAQAGHWQAPAGDRSAPVFERIEQEGDEALASMHRLVGLLRDAPRTSPVAGMEQVRELVEGFSRTGPPAVLDLSPALPDRLEEALGGELTAGPLPEGGWQVRATLPGGEAVRR